MTLTVRPAQATDAAQMAALLNEIIALGGTTAMTTPLSAEDMVAWMAKKADRSAWHVAVDGDQVLGFQLITPQDDIPPEATDIATFTKVGQVKRGIGSALFAATQEAARKLGYTWINANIRTDNTGGVRYYDSRGFRTYHTKIGVDLGENLIVDKVLKRFDL
jgi:L-amino acid N-acyltransferase YncA